MKKTLSQTNKDLDLRRFGKDVYSKALGEGGGGEITADDITPELLEDEKVLIKIWKWGLSDEQISHLHVLHGIDEQINNSFQSDEDLSAYGEFGNFLLDEDNFQTLTPRYSNLLDEIQTLEEYKYLVYSIYGNFDDGGIVLKRTGANKLSFESVDRGVKIFFREAQYCNIYIGTDTM